MISNYQLRCPLIPWVVYKVYYYEHCCFDMLSPTFTSKSGQSDILYVYSTCKSLQCRFINCVVKYDEPLFDRKNGFELFQLWSILVYLTETDRGIQFALLYKTWPANPQRVLDSLLLATRTKFMHSHATKYFRNHKDSQQ